MDAITQRVKSLYEKYPYPYAGVKNALLKDLYALIYYTFSEAGVLESEFSRYSYLDAGCGTGQRILGLAEEFPEASFNCIDVTNHSLEIAKNQALKMGIENIDFKQDNIVAFMANKQFDVVSSVGVIHHLSEPEKGVQNLARALKDDGVMFIHVYHTYGEYDRMLVRDLVRTLSEHQPLEVGAAVIKELGASLPKSQYGHLGYNDDLSEEDHLSKDVDVFLHPRVFTYNFQEGLSLFNNSGLDWAAINSVNTVSGSFFMAINPDLDENNFKPFEYLKTDRLRKLFEGLSNSDRMKVMELLIRPTSFSMIAGKESARFKLSARLEENAVTLSR